MSTALLIICERTGTWAAALRRALADRVKLRETRSLEACESELSTAPQSILALELNATNVERVLDLLARLAWQAPQARAIVLADRRWRAYEWLLREAGAVHVVTSRRDLGSVADLVAAHVARLPVRPASVTQRIWDALPWGD